MDRRQLLGVLGIGVVAKPSDSRAAQPVPIATLTVRIVPTSYRDRTGRAIEVSPPSQHFHVVATNVSEEPIRLWREWCSWGYFNLSFRVTEEAGLPVEVRKKRRGWDKNYPDWEIIPPGGHQVRDVNLDPTTWEGLIQPEPNSHRPVRMRAIFEIRPDAQAEEHGIWTGQVSSPEDVYGLWR